MARVVWYGRGNHSSIQTKERGVKNTAKQYIVAAVVPHQITTTLTIVIKLILQTGNDIPTYDYYSLSSKLVCIAINVMTVKEFNFVAGSFTWFLNIKGCLYIL